MPITWKNVSDSSGSSQAAVGAQLFEQARRAMNDGFGGLEGALEAKQEEQRAAWQQGKVNNTEAAIANLRQYATADEYAAAQAAGQLEDGSQYGAQIDRNAFNAFADTRLGNLQENGLRNQEYADNQFEVAVRPLIQEYNDLGDDFLAKAAFRAKHDLGSEREMEFASQENARRLDLSQESRAVSGEARAVSAEGRAAQSAAQNNTRFGWDVSDRNKAQQVVARGEGIDALITESVNGFTAKQDALLAEQKAIGAEFEIPTNKAGELDFTNVPNDVRMMINARLTDKGFGEEDSASLRIKNFRSQIDPSTPVAEQVAAVAKFEATLAAQNKLGEADQAKVDGAHASINKKVAEQSRLLQVREDAYNASPFAVGQDLNPADTALKVGKEMRELIGEDWGDAETSRLLNATQNLTTKGITAIDPVSGETIRMPITPAMIKMGLYNTDGDLWDGWDEADNLEKAIVEQNTSPEAIAAFLAGQKEYESIQTEKDELANQGVQALTDATRSVRQNAGLPGNIYNGDVVTSLNRSLKNAQQTSLKEGDIQAAQDSEVAKKAQQAYIERQQLANLRALQQKRKEAAIVDQEVRRKNFIELTSPMERFPR
jgi:hypothetical protein